MNSSDPGDRANGPGEWPTLLRSADTVNATATDPNTADQSQTDPPDLALMEQVVNQLLDPDAVPGILPPGEAELDMLTLQLRGHLDLLIPEVEAAARRLPKNGAPRYCVLACLGESREWLRAEPSARSGGAVGHARRLARALKALVDHYQALSGTGS